MKALFLYVDGGKGHYVPAKAVMEAFMENGHEATLEEFFDYLDIRWLGAINKWWWRQMLKMPKLENRLSRHNDADSNGMTSAVKFAKKHCKYILNANLDENKVDFVFCTHPYASTVISAMFKSMNINIPVYYFATDVFNAPVAAVSKNIRKFLISTEEGYERVVKLGQKEDSIEIVSFPLQKSVQESEKLSKEDARRKLKLDPDLFTLQLNLGGEGLGSISLIDRLMATDKAMQIVVIGGIDKSMKKKINHLNLKHKNSKSKLIVAGFVNNINEYLMASDIIAGRAGINTIVEAMYMHRPFLITELVYTVIPSAEYVEKYKVGWNATGDVDKQVDIVTSCLDNENFLNEMDLNFNKLPIRFSAKEIANFVENDVKSLAN